MEPSGVAYPITFTFDPPEKVANWRPLVAWILAIPHYIILGALRSVAQALTIISWFAIVFTGAMPESLANMQAMVIRYETRVFTYGSFMREEYPPFAFEMTPNDGGEDPRTRVDLQPVVTDRNRLTVAFRYLLVIPHLIVLVFLGIAAGVCVFIAFFAVLFTGKWPDGLRAFVLNVQRWFLRVEMYMLLLTDEYPPFQLG